jgi:hypothetical protein
MGRGYRQGGNRAGCRCGLGQPFAYLHDAAIGGHQSPGRVELAEIFYKVVPAVAPKLGEFGQDKAFVA